MHGAHQDRLAKKPPQKKSAIHAQANVYLEAKKVSAGTKPGVCACGGPTGGFSSPGPGRGSWTRPSGWIAPLRSATIGWCVTTTASSYSSRRAATTRQQKAKWWNVRRAESLTIECHGRAVRRQQIPPQSGPAEWSGGHATRPWVSQSGPARGKAGVGAAVRSASSMACDSRIAARDASQFPQ